MNYSKYYPVDAVNGEGLRATLFVSGCTHGCHGCYNKATWSPTSGQPFNKEMEDRIIADLKSTTVPLAGLSLTGGDPLHEANIHAVLRLCRRVRAECPDKTIWLWTGYTLKDLEEVRFSDKIGLARLAILDEIDVLVDGKYIEAEADPELLYRGSHNQLIHNFTEL